MDAPTGFEVEHLFDDHVVYVGRLPEELVPSAEAFEELWHQHPMEGRLIRNRGCWVRTRRWERAYGVSYRYAGQENEAAPMLPTVAPLLEWARQEIDARFTGVMITRYDAALGHYIGPHRDSTRNMIDGAPIVTISLGAPRTFLLTWGADANESYSDRSPNRRPWQQRRLPNTWRDFVTSHGMVIVLPYSTNRGCYHQVPKADGEAGRRIAVAVRGLKQAESGSP